MLIVKNSDNQHELGIKYVQNIQIQIFLTKNKL